MAEIIELQDAAKKRGIRQSAPDILTLSSFQEAKDIFLLHCHAKNLSQKTIRWYEKKLEELKQFLPQTFSNVPFQNITTDVLRNFIFQLQKKDSARHKNTPISSHTVAGTVKVIKCFFRFLFEEGYLPQNPSERVRVPKVLRKIIKPLTKEEIRKLLSMPDITSFTGYRNYLMMLIFLDTGMRLSELLNLRVQDIDWNRYTFKILGKGNKEREVPFGMRVAKVFVKYLKWRKNFSDSGIVFINKEGQPLHPRYLQYVFKEYGEKAEVENLHPHCFRHTAALQWIVSGGDVFSLQRLLGHTSLEMVRVYVSLAASDVSAKHRQFGLVDHLDIKNPR